MSEKIREKIYDLNFKCTTRKCHPSRCKSFDVCNKEN